MLGEKCALKAVGCKKMMPPMPSTPPTPSNFTRTRPSAASLYLPVLRIPSTTIGSFVPCPSQRHWSVPHEGFLKKIHGTSTGLSSSYSTPAISDILTKEASAIAFAKPASVMASKIKPSYMNATRTPRSVLSAIISVYMHSEMVLEDDITTGCAIASQSQQVTGPAATLTSRLSTTYDKVVPQSSLAIRQVDITTDVPFHDGMDNTQPKWSPVDGANRNILEVADFEVMVAAKAAESINLKHFATDIGDIEWMLHTPLSATSLHQLA